MTLTRDEVERAKAQLKVSLLVAMESSSSRAEQIARQHMAYGRLIDADEILREVDAVTVESGARHRGRDDPLRPDGLGHRPGRQGAGPRCRDVAIAER